MGDLHQRRPAAAGGNGVVGAAARGYCPGVSTWGHVEVAHVSHVLPDGRTLLDDVKVPHRRADRVIAELVPGHVAGHGRNVEIVRGHGGDFAVAVHVNGTRVPMVLDTGASSVVLTQDAAKAAGLPVEVLNYTVNIDTANGRTRAAAVTLDRLAVGGLIERAVPALVAQRGQLKNNLLGMSFLNRLQSWEVQGDRLRLRGTP